MTNPVAKAPSDIVNSTNTIFVIIYFMEDFVMCVENKKEIVPDSDLRNSLTASIMNLSKENQIKVFAKSIRIRIFQK